LVKLLVKENLSSCVNIPPLSINTDIIAFSNLDKANTLDDFFVSIANIDYSHTNLSQFEPKKNNSNYKHYYYYKSICYRRSMLSHRK
jgi:hypothetical protein